MYHYPKSNEELSMSDKIGSGKRLAPTALNDDQWAWLQMEKEKTMNAVSSIVRRLIQNEVDKAKKNGEME